MCEKTKLDFVVLNQNNKRIEGDILNLQSKNLMMRGLNERDLKEVLKIYHSNSDFLLAHMDQTAVDIEWLVKEHEEMKKMDFKTIKIIEKSSNKIIGFMDFCIQEESYLSLMMIQGDLRGNGYGKEAYESLEEHLKGENAKIIRIDVVYDYNQKVLQFWKNRGFREIEKIQLQWTDKMLNAMVMKKNI